MKWNWQQENWPNFTYDESEVEALEREFLHKSGLFHGTWKHINEQEQESLKFSLICDEALKSSEIEGEFLNRDSLQSSIKRNFGLKSKKGTPAEEGIAQMMADLYQNFKEPLSKKNLCKWHEMLMNGRGDLQRVGSYRTHKEAMQVVSGSIDKPKVHFEAPPSKNINSEMKLFINWFNNKELKLSPLIKSGIAHLYFVSVHPFEDGNGRIARALSEKTISQAFNEACLISLSTVIEKNKKNYYTALANANKDLEITEWLIYFAQTVIAAQDYSQNLVEFLIDKAKLYEKHAQYLNNRQKKVIDRIFKEGIEGFKGGLSAENYISITKTSRATATRDLQELVKLKVLKREGQLKNTRYYLNHSN